MPDDAHPSLARVLGAAAAAGLAIEVHRFPEGTRTAEDAARAVGCDVAQIVKSLVFIVDERPVVALVSGADRLDAARLADATGGREVRRANGDEVRSATGFAIGGVPPLGHAREVTVLIDEHLLALDTVWAAAGLPDAVFAAQPWPPRPVRGRRASPQIEVTAADDLAAGRSSSARRSG